MSAVIPFLRPAARSDRWSQQELAEFYRVEAALLRAGIGMASEHGVTDEGEPWFVFCRPDGDVIMHFARIDGSYLIASDVLDRPVRGADFRALIDQIARLHPNLLPIPAVARGTKLVVHPAALLAALVAAAALSLSSEEAHAGELAPGLDPLAPADGGGGTGQGQPQPARARGASGPGEEGDGRKQVEAIILSTMIFAAEALAGGHAAASADLDPLLADLASGTAHQGGQSDLAAGTGGGGNAGPTAAPVQPTALTAQGSGASQDTAAPGGRIDPAPAIRADVHGDRAGLPGRETESHAPSMGNDIGFARVAAETGAVGTGGQQASATGRSEGAAESSAGLGADSGDQRGHGNQSLTPDSNAQPRLAEAARAEAGSGAGSPGWVPAAGQAEANRTSAASAASASRDLDDRGSDRGHGARADAAADSSHVERAENGHAGMHQDGQARAVAHQETGSGPQGSATGDRGSALQKAAPASGVGSPVDPDRDVHATGPAEQSDHRGATPRDAHSIEAGSEPGTPPGDAGMHSGSAPGAPLSHAPVALAASVHGPEDSASDRGSGGGDGPSSGHGPGASSSADPSQAAAPSSGSPHGGLDNAPAHAAAPDDAASPTPQHTASRDLGPHSDGSAASQGQGPDAANRGSTTQSGGEPAGAQDHPNADMPASSAVPAGSGRHEASHAEATPPERGTPAPAGSQDALNHGDAGGPPAPRAGPSATADPGRGQVDAPDAVSHRVDQGAQGGAPERLPSAEAQHPSDDGKPVQAATLPPQGPSDSAAPRAAIDSKGSLVFHGDAHHDAPPPAAAHGPDEAAHPSISLVGVSDHGPVVHDLYHHG